MNEQNIVSTIEVCNAILKLSISKRFYLKEDYDEYIEKLNEIINLLEKNEVFTNFTESENGISETGVLIFVAYYINIIKRRNKAKMKRGRIIKNGR